MLRVRQIELSQLKPWEENPRLNNQAVGAVAKSIHTFGFNVPILCDQDLNIIAGHTRWKAAKKLGMKTAPVIMLKMTETQRRAFSLADNKTGEIAQWDFPKLRELLEDLGSEDIDLACLGYSSAELVALLSEESELDWAKFDMQLKEESGESYVILPVKVPPTEKEPLQVKIESYAKKTCIKGKDKSIVAGKVLQRLLVVANG